MTWMAAMRTMVRDRCQVGRDRRETLAPTRATTLSPHPCCKRGAACRSGHRPRRCGRRSRRSEPRRTPTTGSTTWAVVPQGTAGPPGASGRDRSTTAGGRELGRIVSVDPGKELTGTIMGAYMSYVLVPCDHDTTRLLLKVVIRGFPVALPRNSYRRPDHGPRPAPWR